MPYADRLASVQGNEMMLQSRRLMHSVVVAFLAFLVMLLFWPSLVLKNEREGARNAAGLVWDAMLSVKSPKQVIRSDQTVYDLEAHRLQIMTEDSNQVLLTRPQMMATEQDGSWMVISAKAGLYNKKSRVLQLIADVHIQDAQGSDLRTETAVVRLAEREAEGHSRIRGRMGKHIDVDAAGFRLQNTQARYEFLGATAMHIRRKEESS